MLAGKQQQGEAELSRGVCLLARPALKPHTAACRDLGASGTTSSQEFNFLSPVFGVLFPLPAQVQPSGKPSAPQLTQHILLPPPEPLQTPKQ